MEIGEPQTNTNGILVYRLISNSYLDIRTNGGPPPCVLGTCHTATHLLILESVFWNFPERYFRTGDIEILKKRAYTFL